MSVSCNLCGKTWDRDPVLEVECPVCGAEPGEECSHLSPSGHDKSAAFQGLPSYGHDERDLEADRQGAYGDCPVGSCTEHPDWKGPQEDMGLDDHRAGEDRRQTRLDL